MNLKLTDRLYKLSQNSYQNKEIFIIVLVHIKNYIKKIVTAG
jgi:hypothetical protein